MVTCIYKYKFKGRITVTTTMRSHDTLVVEARAALPLDGGVKCRQPERAEDGRNRSVPRGETGNLGKM